MRDPTLHRLVGDVVAATAMTIDLVLAQRRANAAAAPRPGRYPVQRVVLTDGASGRAIASYLSERRFGIRTHLIAQGVLDLPSTFAEYRRGRHRQAMRTNLTRATEQGYSCRRLEALEDRHAYVDLVDPEVADAWRREQVLAKPEADCWIALDANGSPVGLAVVGIDTETAMIWWLAATEHLPRWLLHAVVIEALIESGVRVVLVAARMAPVLPSGQRYFQRLLGYHVAHLAPTLVEGAFSAGRRVGAGARVQHP
jgi:hypothetical protein